MNATGKRFDGGPQGSIAFALTLFVGSMAEAHSGELPLPPLHLKLSEVLSKPLANSDPNLREPVQPAAEAVVRSPQELKVRGSLSMGVASSDRLLNHKQTVPVPHAALKITHVLAPGIYWRYEGDISTRRAHGDGDAAVLSEAYLNYREGELDLRLGIQTIAWGRADVLNPTDNLTPYRYTWLTMTDADQRVGAPALSVGYQFEFGKVTAIALPFFEPSKVPLGNTGELRVREAKPESLQGDFALKLDRQSSGPEWSISWYHGHSLRPNLVPAADIATSATLELQHPRVDVLGADFAAPWRSLVFRGEMAYTMADDCCDVGGVQFRKRDNVFVVLGVETAFWDGWRLVTQAFHKQHFGDAADASAAPALFVQLARASDVVNDELRSEYTGLSLGIYPTSFGARFKGSLDTAWIAQTNDYTIRPRLSYSISDQLSVNLAADLYGGDREGPLGRLHDNSLVMTNLMWAFGWARK